MDELELLKHQVQASQMQINRLQDEMKQTASVVTSLAQWFIANKQIMDSFQLAPRAPQPVPDPVEAKPEAAVAPTPAA